MEIARKEDTAPKIDQFVHHLPQSGKQSLLLSMLQDDALSRVIVFTRTKHGANKVAGVLENAGIQVNAIHGNKSQPQREKALREFRTGRARVLVATDIAARGIDVTGISHVINFDLPVEAESYVHRIGRTARAGAAGIAISFCDPSERGVLRQIERQMNYTIEVVGDAPPPMTHQPKRPGAPGQAQRRRYNDRGNRGMRSAASAGSAACSIGQTLYIDGDACPVRDEVYRVADRLGLPVFVVANGSRPIRPTGRPNVTMITVAAGADVADDWIAERVTKADVCITSDIPLASRCLAKGGRRRRTERQDLDGGQYRQRPRRPRGRPLPPGNGPEHRRSGASDETGPFALPERTRYAGAGGTAGVTRATGVMLTTPAPSAAPSEAPPVPTNPGSDAGRTSHRRRYSGVAERP